MDDKPQKHDIPKEKEYGKINNADWKYSGNGNAQCAKSIMH